MFTDTDYDKLQQIMEESPEKKELLTRLLDSHQMELSAVSHEIRNPLTLAYSTYQLMESSSPEVRNLRHWTHLGEELEYMKALLEELSSYNNSTKLFLKEMDMESFLKSLVLSFAASIAETEIEFTSRIEPGLPTVSADAVKLREVLLNLLKNARDALSQASCPHPSISLHAGIKDSFLSIAVTDNGCGIQPEQLATIFEPFITYKKDGTGLGLSIARRIANAHGGSLTVSSEPGVQTVFTLTLPV